MGACHCPAGAVVVAAITLGILNGTLQAAKNAVDAARGQAEAAKIQAQATLTTSQTAQKQLEISERPWIGVVDRATLGRVTVQYGTVAKPDQVTFDSVKLCVKNVGPTPARMERYGMGSFAPPLTPRDDDEVPIGIVDCKSKYSLAQDVFDRKAVFFGFPSNLILPNQESCVDFRIDATANLKGEIAKERQKGNGLYLMACVDYMSAMHLHYQTQVCRYYDPTRDKSNLFICPGYDYAN